MNKIDISRITNNRLWKLMCDKDFSDCRKFSKALIDKGFYTSFNRPANKADYGSKEEEQYKNNINSLARTVTRTLYNNRFQNDDFLIACCRFFECSADYLLGLIELPTHGKTDFNKLTGLSDNSIATLKKVKKNWDKREKNILNYIMKDSDLFLDFLGWLSLYIDNEYTIPLAYDKEKGAFPCNNAMGSVVLGKKIKDNKGNDGYKMIGIGVDILESHAMLKMQEIINTWKKAK